MFCLRSVTDVREEVWDAQVFKYEKSNYDGVEMGYHDIMQVCLNGHQITASYEEHPEFRKEFCDICGEKTITFCPQCKAPILGKYHADGVVANL